MADLVWEDPSPEAIEQAQAGRKSKHAVAAAALRSNPGKWAIVSQVKSAEGAQQLAASIRGGRVPAYEPAGNFEAVADGNTVKVRFEPPRDFYDAGPE